MEHATGWDTEDEKLMKEMDQCVGDEEPVQASACAAWLEGCRMHEERSEDENFSVKLGEN